MTAAVVIGILALAALAYVIAPIGRTKTTVEETESETSAEEKKRVALTGILDLEEERDGGKLSEDEFVDLRTRYEQDAVRALEEMDAGQTDRSRGSAESASSLEQREERLEREIADARAKLRCGTCGAPRGLDATRCSSCGSSY